MSRVVALLLAVLMPLQFAWGAAAAYCQHEATPHFGHHAHVHQADAKKPATGQTAAHDDCASCHATGPVVATEPGTAADPSGRTQRLAVPRTEAHASALARAPDRPQWRRLA